MSDYTYKQSTSDNSELTYTVEVSPEKHKQIEEQVYQELAKDVEIPGFRKGNAPKNQVMNQIGNQVYSSTIQRLLPEVTAEIVEEEGLNPVTEVDYNLEKVDDNGVTFSFSFVNYPEVKLPDLSKIKIEKQKPKVTAQDVDEVVQRLFQQEQSSDESEQKEEKTSDSQQAPVEVTDEKVKELGMEGIETVDQLRARVSEKLQENQGSELDRQFEMQLLQKTVEAAEVDVPQKLIEQQQANLKQDYFKRIEDLEMSKEDFLKAQGLTEEQLEENLKEEAEAKIGSELLLNEIAKQYELTPDMAEVEEQLNAIEDEQTKEQYNTPQGKRHIATVLVQQRAMEKLKEEVQIEETEVDLKEAQGEQEQTATQGKAKTKQTKKSSSKQKSASTTKAKSKTNKSTSTKAKKKD